MNAIDLFVCLVLALAVWNGWRRGFIVQICSLAGIVAAVLLAARYGDRVAELLHLDPEFATAGGFVTLFVAVTLAVAVGAHLLRRIFRFAGFGLPDILLGVAVAAAKYLLVLSVLFSAFDRFNTDYTLIGRETIEESRSYRPVMCLSDRIFPAIAWLREQMPDTWTLPGVGGTAPSDADDAAEAPQDEPRTVNDAV